MLLLAVSQLRHRWPRFLSLLLSVIAATALTTAALSITQGLKASVKDIFSVQFSQSAATADVSGLSPDEVTAGLETLNNDPAISETSLERTISVKRQQDGTIYDSARMTSLAEGPLQWRDLIDGALPAAPGDVATADDAPLGSQIEVIVPGVEGSQTLTVTGHVSQTAEEQLIGGQNLYATPEQLEQWDQDTSVTGRISVASNDPSQAVTALRQAFPHDSVTARSSAAAAEQETNKYLGKRRVYFVLIDAFVAVVAVIAALVIASGYSVIATARRRELALLKATGATTSQLVASTAIETALLGALGSLIGIPLGTRLASFAAEHADSVGITVPIETTHLSLPHALAIGVAATVITIIAAQPAARAAARVPTVEGLTNTTTTRSSRATRATLILTAAICAVLAVLGISALSGLGPAAAKAAAASSSIRALAAVGSAGAGVLAVVCLAGLIVPALVGGLGHAVGGRLPATVHLAFVQTTRQLEKATALVAITTAGVALVAAVLAGQRALTADALFRAGDTGGVDVAVASLDGESLPPELIDPLSNSGSVDQVAVPRAARLSADGTSIDTVLMDPAEAESVSRGAITPQPGQLVLSSSDAARLDVEPGDVVVASLVGTSVADGPEAEVELTVSESPTPTTVVDPGAIDAALDQHAQDTGAAALGIEPPSLPTPAALIRLTGEANQGSDSPALREVMDTVSSAGVPVTVDEALGARENIEQQTARIVTISNLLTIVALAISAVGIINTLILMVRERARDNRVLSAVGMSRVGLATTVVIELAVLLAAGAVIGWSSGYAAGGWVAGVV